MGALDPAASAPRRAPARRSRAAAALLAGAVSTGWLAGCGATRTLSGPSAARQIARSLSARFPSAHSRVTCPAAVPARAGQRFTCHAVIDGQPLPVHATVVNSSGQFQPVLGAAVIPLGQAERSLATDLSRQLGQPVTVSCPNPQRVLVAQPGQRFTCEATAGGRHRSLAVTVSDLSGRVTFRLGAPA